MDKIKHIFGREQRGDKENQVGGAVDETECKTTTHTSTHARMSARMRCQRHSVIQPYKYREGANARNAIERSLDLHLRHPQHPKTLAAAIFHLHSHLHHHHRIIHPS
jgi:hypothetical protein